MTKNLGSREITKEFNTIEIAISYQNGFGSFAKFLVERESKIFSSFGGKCTNFDVTKHRTMKQLNELDYHKDAIIEVKIDGKEADLKVARAMIERASGEI